MIVVSSRFSRPRQVTYGQRKSLLLTALSQAGSPSSSAMIPHPVLLQFLYWLIYKPYEYLAGLFVMAVFSVIFMPRETTSLSSAQVSSARQLVNVQPNARITPIGLRKIPGFLDDSMQFKFVAYVDSIDQIFLHEYVPPSRFGECGTCGLMESESPEWWDIKGKQFVGASFWSKPGEHLTIGIVPAPRGGFTVYAKWNEV